MFGTQSYYRVKGSSVVVNFKACERCHGDVQRARDMYGEYLQCLQCGFMKDIPIVRYGGAPAKGRLRPGRPRKNGDKRKAA